MQITETVIPLDFISGLSPFNVRQLDPSDDVSSLKATVRAVGLINPLVVHRGADNRFVVLAGGRRWRALCEIEDETPGAFWNIPAKMVDAAGNAELIALSTMENTQTLAMHPVRQFEAFAAIAHALPSPEKAVEVIAKEFGLTRQQVRQRLALGDLSPKIRKAWLDGEIDAEAARAYAECDDVAAQEAFFETNANNWTRDNAYQIRKALLSGEIAGDDVLAVFVGDEAYLAAGGKIKDSLWISERRYSKPLLEKLAREKLLAQGERIKTAEGWGFVILFDEDDNGCWATSGKIPDYLAAERVRQGEIGDRVEEIQNDETFAASGEGAIELDALLAEYDAITSKGFMRALTTAQRQALGILVDIDEDGRLDVRRAIRRVAQSDAAPSATNEDDDDAGDVPSPLAGEGGRRPDEGAKPAPLPPSEPIGKALRTVLDETMNAALQDVTERNVNLAMIYAVATLGCQCGGSILDLRLHARRGWTPRHELLKALAQLRFEKALQLAAASSLNDLTTAFCELVGAAIDTARFDKIGAGLDLLNVAAPRAAIGDALVEHFDPALYFHAATRDAAIAAIRELEGEAKAADRGKLKKPDLIEHVTVIAKHRNWLPPVLRLAAPVPDHVTAVTKMIEPAPAPDTRSTAEAMLDAIEADPAEADAEDDASDALETNRARVAYFLKHACWRGEGAGQSKASLLGAAFDAFAAARGWPDVSPTALSKALGENGIEKHRIKNGVHYLGVSLKDVAKEAAQ
jgi:ParB family chromosome partitioning protein